MSAEDTPTLKPVTPERVVQELRSLHAKRASGELNAANWDQRFARMVGELRERRISGNRAEINAALEPLRTEGILSDTDWIRLTKQLGLA
ncbi:MAG: hypothetical protein ACREL6_08790 [Gemmatimonadales bacterium]